MSDAKSSDRFVKTCNKCGRSYKYLSKHLARMHGVLDARKRHDICSSTPRYKVSKLDLAKMIADLPLKKEEIDAIWKMKSDLKKFIDTGELDNRELDLILGNVAMRFI